MEFVCVIWSAPFFHARAIYRRFDTTVLLTIFFSIYSYLLLR